MENVTLSIQVSAEWDCEAGVWVATSDDIPGLVAEHADFKQLQTLVNQLIPILLVENRMLPDHDRAKQNIPVHIAAHAISKMVVAA
jgi:hypothetical protein